MARHLVRVSLDVPSESRLGAGVSKTGSVGVFSNTEAPKVLLPQIVGATGVPTSSIPGSSCLGVLLIGLHWAPVGSAR